MAILKAGNPSSRQIFFNEGWNFQGGNKIIGNLATPLANNDAANKAYVDALFNTAVSGAHFTAAVQVATTANITLALTVAGTVIDGYTLVNGDRVLVKDQNTASENGIYDVTTAGLVRSADADGTPDGEVARGDSSYVITGTANGNETWVLITAGPINVGVTGLTYTQSGAAPTYTASTGITLTQALDFQLDFTNLTAANTDGNDIIAFWHPGQGAGMKSSTIGNVLANNNIAHGVTTNGFYARTGINAYAARTITPDTTTGTEGITITDGDGGAGNPLIGFNISNLDVITVLENADKIVFLDASTGKNSAISYGNAFANFVSGITVDGSTVTLSSHAISFTAGDGISSLVTGNNIRFDLSVVANSGLVFNQSGQLELNLSASAIGGKLDVTNGGTNLTTISTGGIIYGSNTDVYSELAIGQAGQVLTVVAGVPSWVTPGSAENNAAGPGITIAQDGVVSINLNGANYFGGLSKILGPANETLGIYIDANNDTANYVSTFYTGNGSLQLKVDSNTLGINQSGNLYVNGVAASIVSGLASAINTEVFTASKFADSSTIDFTVTNATSVTAVVKSGSINEAHLDVTNTGVPGQVLALDNSAGQFVWTDASSLVPIIHYVDTLPEQVTDMNNINGQGVDMIAVIISAANFWSTFTPNNSIRAEVLINGIFYKIGTSITDGLFWSTDGGTTALQTPTSSASLIFNAEAMAWDIAADDVLNCKFWS